MSIVASFSAYGQDGYSVSITKNEVENSDVQVWQLEITAKEDLVTIADVQVNRGNCVITRDIWNISSGLPWTLHFGDRVSFLTVKKGAPNVVFGGAALACDPIEVVVITDDGAKQTFTWDE